MFRSKCKIEEVEKFLREKLSKGELYEKLTIVDPYFFKTIYNKYDEEIFTIENLTTILKDFECLLKLEIVTPFRYRQNDQHKVRKLEKKLKKDSLTNHQRKQFLKELKVFKLNAEEDLERSRSKLEEEIKNFSIKFKKVELILQEEFHDRFWIIDDTKCFIVGTSLNGIGKKHFYIQDDYLSCDDTKVLLRLFKDNQ